MEHLDTSSRQPKRIRVACNACRRRKIKCTGGQPCANCVSGNEATCYYEEKVRKKPRATPTRAKRPRASQSLEMLGSRIMSLENAIQGIVGHLHNLNDSKPVPSIEMKSADSYVTTSDEDDDEEDEDDDEDDDTATSEGDDHTSTKTYQSEIAKANRSLSPVGIKHHKPSDQAPKLPEPGTFSNAQPPHTADERKKAASAVFKNRSKTQNNLLLNRRLETYFGTHSFMCIFSDKSLDWISKTLGPDRAHLVQPIWRFPYVIHKHMKTLILKWVDPAVYDQEKRTKLLEDPFPDNQELIFGLIDRYYIKIIHSCIFISYRRLRGLFESYYGVKGARKHRFKCSEYLIMNLALAFCLACKIDEDVLKSETHSVSRYQTDSPIPDSLKSMSLKDIIKMKDDLLDDAIFFYFRLSVISDGIETIEAIVLFIMYIETNWFMSQVTFMMTSVAVRYAQDSGLHRAEAYENFTLEEAERRRKVWWYCQYFDMEICFRAGKPPLINHSDVTAASGLETQQSPFNMFSPETPAPSSTPDRVFFTSSEGYVPNQLDLNDLVVNHYYFSLLTRLRCRSYNCLFMASAQIDTFAKLSSTLDQLNAEMLELKNCMPDSAKPRFHNSPSFRILDLKEPREESIMVVHLTYFLHLMVINRIPSMISVADYDEESQRSVEYRNLSANSARTILVLMSTAKSLSSLSFYNWIIFFPVAAFLNLSASVINHPTSCEAYSDLKLLISTSFDLPCMVGSGISELKDEVSQKDIFVSTIMKLVLRIAISIYETKTGTRVLDQDEGLRKHLDSVYEYFPELKKGSKIKHLISVFGDSPFPSGQRRKPSAGNDAHASSSSGVPINGGALTGLYGRNVGEFHSPKMPFSNERLQTSATRDYSQSPTSILNPHRSVPNFSSSANNFYNNQQPVENATQMKHVSESAINRNSALEASNASYLKDDEGSQISNSNSNNVDNFAEFPNPGDVDSYLKIFAEMNDLPNFFFDNTSGLGPSEFGT